MKMNYFGSSLCLWLGAIAVGLTLLGGQALANTVQSDFDPGGTYYGGTEGWFNYGGMPDFAIATPAGGATNWLGVKPQQWWGQITSQSWATPDVTLATWNGSLSLDFDVIVDSLWLPNNTAQAVSVELQVGGGSEGTINKYANPTINTALKDMVQHVSIPLAALQPFDPTATYWNLSVNITPGYDWGWDSGNPEVQPYNPRYYLDNVTWVVPEPATLVLLASCVLGCLLPRSCRSA